ncbi:MAG TPA: hypothetical protein VJ881_03455 [Halanaerobiales bacterium]|nr:hypothetical protein [Halanaerobiales bacterium]
MNKYIQINQQIEKLINSSKKINIIKRLLQESDNFQNRVASIVGINVAEIGLSHLKNSLIRKKNEYIHQVNYTANTLLALFNVPVKEFNLSNFVLGTKDLLNGYAEIEDSKGNLWVLSLNTGEFIKESIPEDEESRETLPSYIKEPCSVLSENDEYLILIKSNNQ